MLYFITKPHSKFTVMKVPASMKIYDTLLKVIRLHLTIPMCVSRSIDRISIQKTPFHDLINNMLVNVL